MLVIVTNGVLNTLSEMANPRLITEKTAVEKVAVNEQQHIVGVLLKI